MSYNMIDEIKKYRYNFTTVINLEKQDE